MTTEGEIYRELQRQARETGRNTTELMMLYVLEGFLSRVAQSQYREQLVLKGGVLLAAWNARRPTRDIDFAALNIDNETSRMLDICCDIASISQLDGITFDTASASAITIRDDDEYSGVRVSMLARLATARITFHIDINVGDPIVPGAIQVDYPRILDSSTRIQLLSYPISMVLAEKIVTALQRGTASTRWRDYGDIYNLTRIHAMPMIEMKLSITAVSVHRTMERVALREVLSDYPQIGQTKYGNWRIKQDRLELPADFGKLLDAIYKFTDPILNGSALETSTWDPLRSNWL